MYRELTDIRNVHIDVILKLLKPSMGMELMFSAFCSDIFMKMCSKVSHVNNAGLRKKQFCRGGMTSHMRLAEIISTCVCFIDVTGYPLPGRNSKSDPGVAWR